MEWCLPEPTDDFSVPSYQDVLEDLYAEDLSLSPIDWFNWAPSRSGKAESPNRYCRNSIKSSFEAFGTDRQDPNLQASKVPSVYQGVISNSRACVEPSLADCSTRASEASSSAQPDCQLEHSIDWTNDIFLNSLLQEDPGNMENPLEPLNMADSINRSLSPVNLLADMLQDPVTLMNSAAKRDTSISTGSFPLFTNDISETWGRSADCQPSCLMTEERSENLIVEHVPEVFSSTELSESNQWKATTCMDEPKCFEEKLLHELEDTIIQLSDRTRICFRDALYRLATTSKEQNSSNQIRSVNFIDGAGVRKADDGSLRVNSMGVRRRPIVSLGRDTIISIKNIMGAGGCVEMKTNVIDRTIASLVFNKPCYVSPDIPCTGSLQTGTENFASGRSFYSLNQPVQSHYCRGPT